MSPQSVMAIALSGRDAEIATLEGLLEHAQHGSGTTLVVSGEAGIIWQGASRRSSSLR